MAGTIDKEALKDLMTGNASFRVVDQVGTLTDNTFDDADQLFTVEGTLAITQAEPTNNDIRIDQSDLPIDTIPTTGEFTIAGTFPSIAIPVMDYFFNKSKIQPTLTTGITGSDGTTKYKDATGYSLDGKRKNVTMMLESKSRKTSIAFMNVTLMAVINWGDVTTSPMGLTLNGTVLTNTTEGQPDIVVLKSAGVAPASLSVESKSGSGSIK